MDCEAWLMATAPGKHKQYIQYRPAIERRTAQERGYTKAWSRYSAQRIKSHPLCVRCGGHDDRPGGMVTDHIVPHCGDHELFWDEANHQTLCKRCHDSKTASEDGGFGR